MFMAHDDTRCKESLPGIRQKTLAYGDKTLMVECRLDRGAVLPKHRRLHEPTARGASPAGMILLELVGTQELGRAAMTALKKIKGIEAKSMVFTH